MTSPTKNVNPKLLKFLKIESRRHSTSLEGLNKSLAQSAAELWLNKFWPILANKTFCGTLKGGHPEHERGRPDMERKYVRVTRPTETSPS